MMISFQLTFSVFQYNGSAGLIFYPDNLKD
jgi:hypothetical protein